MTVLEPQDVLAVVDLSAYLAWHRAGVVLHKGYPAGIMVLSSNRVRGSLATYWPIVDDRRVDGGA